MQANTKFATGLLVVALAALPYAQQATPQSPANGSDGKPAPVKVPTGVPTPVDYVIGPEDVLTVVFWRDKDMSSEVVVRPDGRISLPLLNEVQAAGLTPESLRVQLTEAASKLF